MKATRSCRRGRFRGRVFRLLMTLPLTTSTLLAQAPNEPRSPEETVKALQLPAGFTATLFAGEPDVRQPSGFCFDGRGRMWVAECLSYPNWTGKEGSDRIVIFEDADGDGRFDKRTVFYDKLNYVTGLEVGFGGVYVVAAPNLLFIPDKDADDKPDGPPQVLLDGFGHQGGHNLVNGCTWGPDGWLWGGHGGSSSGQIGAAGAKDADRIFFDGGVWRYHPTKKIFESVIEGTTNPWGLDFDEFGQAFISNSVTPHLYHVIPGGHVERRRQSPNSRYAYEVLPTTADHKHYAGNDWTKSRTGQSDLGGGHAHCGLMIYQGAAFPLQYDNLIFINNIHGDRMNVDVPRRAGSGFVAAHDRDFLTAADPWYFALHVKYGPDGAVYLSDWYDTGECHTRKPNTANGRIYKIAYSGDAPPRFQTNHKPFDLRRDTSIDLANLDLFPNAWFPRHAWPILQERGPDPAVHAHFRSQLARSTIVPVRLRALWGLHITQGLTADELAALLDDKAEWLRAWAIRLLAEDRNPDDAALAKFAQLAATDPSSVVRLHLASALTRIPLDKRWPILKNLIAHEEDVKDANLPLMYWYALEPMVAADPKRGVALAVGGKIPKLREFAVRRVAEKSATTKDTKGTKN
jgi:putative membrane-bound dehydrogenase-like protein